jgi:hypothetical protein
VNKLNIKTITLQQGEARQKYRQLLASNIETPLNRTRKRVYHSLSRGKKIIDVYTAIEQAGLNELKQPRIAICRADAERCYFYPSTRWNGRDTELTFGGTFTQISTRWQNGRHNRKERVEIPDGSFPTLTDKILSTSVPQIPQEHMPGAALKNYYILWEVEHWTEHVARDPLLLRRLSKNLFEVLAEWELTELEWAIARGAF